MPTVVTIGRMVLESLARVWPLLVISVPVAVALRVSGVAGRLTGAFGKRPLIGILIATAVGALGPFCSCTVIPVIAAMLVGGVPLAPVVSFWVASPTMDPEIFFMSVAFLGWPLAIGRLLATLALSLTAGFVAHWVIKRGWIGDDFLREGVTGSRVPATLWQRVKGLVLGNDNASSKNAVAASPINSEAGCGCAASSEREAETKAGASPALRMSWLTRFLTNDKVRQVVRESISMTLWLARFMLLAFVLEALIKLYVPQHAVVQWVGQSRPWAPALAALVGIPLYTGNLMAVPLIGGLLSQGMSPGAALAFLIAGPITTIPAMAAVWGVVKRRVFVLYIAVGVVGAIVLGYLYSAVSLLVNRPGL